MQSDCKIIRRLPEAGEIVRVHMDLNSGCLAVRSMDPSSDCYNLTLVKQTAPAYLSDVEFRVQDKAYERVVEDEVRGVCAYAKGTWVQDEPDVFTSDAEPTTRVYYNPFRHKYFQTENDEIAKEASWIMIQASDEGYRIEATGM